jgi:multicomponent K+:H+ antiporter subunit E
MRGFLPFPLLSAGLLILWLLLTQSVALTHLVLGSVLALVGPWAMALLDPPKARIRRPGAILRLCFMVLVDVIRSNIAVARIILGRKDPRRTPGFVDVALRLRDPYGLAVLASIITATPGTLWVNFESANGVLTIHVLDLIDENVWVETVQQRYERVLLEIFE